MFLFNLTETAEQNFFMNLAYLLAVVEDYTPKDEVGTGLAEAEKALRDVSAMWLEPGFSMDPQEFFALCAFATEMGLTDWNPGCAWEEQWTCIPTTVPKDSVYPIGHILRGRMETFPSASRLSSEAKMNCVLGALEDVWKELPQNLSMLKKKTILLELAAMANADGDCSEVEKQFQLQLYKKFNIYPGLLDDFVGLTASFRMLYAQASELLNE